MSEAVPDIAQAEPAVTRTISGPRVQWVDYAKGVGMVLVVFGHVWRGLNEAHFAISPGTFERVDSWLYSFHMPLFFLLSGLFAARSARKPAGSALMEKIGTLLYPYVLWSILQAIVNRAAASATNASVPLGNAILGLPYQPYAQFWFLYVLFLCFILFLALYKVRIPVWGIFLCAAAIYFVGRPVHLEKSVIPFQLRDQFLFFALGALIQKPMVEIIPRLRTSTALAAAVLFTTALTLGIAGGLFHSHPQDPALSTSTLSAASARLALALVGIAAVVLFSLALERAGAQLVLLLGQFSLQIYVAHIIAAAGTRILLIKILGVRSLPAHLVLDTAAGLILPLLFSLLAKRLGWTWLFALRRSSPDSPNKLPRSV